jgi:hypothetical protein
VHDHTRHTVSLSRGGATDRGGVRGANISTIKGSRRSRLSHQKPDLGYCARVAHTRQLYVVKHTHISACDALQYSPPRTEVADANVPKAGSYRGGRVSASCDA